MTTECNSLDITVVKLRDKQFWASIVFYKFVKLKVNMSII